MQKYCLKEKAKRKGSVLVITLMIVTLMSAAALSAAVNSYSIIANSASYNDSDVAKEAAMAGVADLTNRLKNGNPDGSSYINNPQTALINFDAGSGDNLLKKSDGTYQELSNTKKAPYIKYYSFTPQEKIKTISRCTKVAAAAAYDSASASYILPSDVFTTLSASMDSVNRSKILQQNGFKAFQNPKAYTDPSTNQPYQSNTADYWKVYMGGPLDQGSVTSSGVSNAGLSSKQKQGLFSNSEYLQYDLIILSLPDYASLTLDDESRENLENWIRLGGKMMIDSVGSTYGIYNAPFSDAVETGIASSGSASSVADTSKNWAVDEFKNYTLKIIAGKNQGLKRKITSNSKNSLTVDGAYPFAIDSSSRYSILEPLAFDWELFDNKTNPNTVSSYDNFSDLDGMNDQVWVMKNAYDSSATNIDWQKEMQMVTNAQKITGEYRVREIYKNLYPAAVTYPPSGWDYVGNESKSIDNSFPSGKVYFRNFPTAKPMATGFAVGDRVFLMTIRHKYQANLDYWNYDTQITGIIDEINPTENYIKLNKDKFLCLTPNVLVNGKYSQWRDKDYPEDSLKCTQGNIANLMRNPDYTLTGRTEDQTDENIYGYAPSVYITSEDDNYFTKRSKDLFGAWSGNDNYRQLLDDASYNEATWDASMLTQLWAGGSAATTIEPGEGWVPVSSAAGYAVGSVVIVEPKDSAKEPLWGKVNDIDYAGNRLKIDLHAGPTSRSGHSLVGSQDGNKIYLFGGSDLANRYANGHLDWSASYMNGSKEKPGIDQANFAILPDVRNDLWEYDLSTSSWKLIKPTNTLANRPMPRKTSMLEYASYQEAGVDKEKLVLVGGSTGGSDDNGVSIVGRYADVWSFDMTNNSWSMIMDRETIEQGAIKLSDNGVMPPIQAKYFSEVYARPNTTNSPDSVNKYPVYVEPLVVRESYDAGDSTPMEPILSDGNLQAYTGNVNDIILVTNLSVTNYPAGLTVGDTIRVNSKNDSSGSYNDNKLVSLQGTISSIIKLNDFSDKSRYLLRFNQPMTGSHTEDGTLTGDSDPVHIQERLNRGLAITVTSYCDQVLMQEPNSGTIGARCMAPGDVVMYYGAQNNPANSTEDDYMDKVYWGRVSNITEPSLGIQEKSFKQLYKGPFFMYNPDGYYDKNTDQLLIFGGYNYLQGQQPTWRLDGALRGTPSWHFVQPEKAAASKYKVNRGTDAGNTSRVGIMMAETGDGSIADNTINRLKLKHGKINDIAIGTKYYVTPATSGIAGRLWGTVKSITKSGVDYYVNFDGNLTTSGITGNAGDIAANDGLILTYASSPNLSNQAFDIDSSMITNFDVSGAPLTMTVNCSDFSDNCNAKRFYIGKKVTMQPYFSSGVVDNKILTAIVEDLDYDSGTSSYTVKFQYMPAFGQWDDDDNLLTHDGSNLYRATKDASGYYQAWKGALSAGKDTISWHYINAGNGSIPKYRANAAIYWDNSSGKLAVWGGGSQFNFLWKISPDIDKKGADFVSWNSVMNDAQDVIGADGANGRPFGLKGSRPAVIKNGTTFELAFFSGTYNYAYPRQNGGSLIGAGVLSPAQQADNNSADVWSEDNSNGDFFSYATVKTAVKFTHTLFSSLWDRHPEIGGNKIFRLDDATQRDILQLGTDGFAITSIGSDFDVLATYPCVKTGTLENNEKISLRTDANDASKSHKVCKLATMAMAPVGNNGGFLFLSSRMLTYNSSNLSLADQIYNLDIMKTAAAKNPSSAMKDYNDVSQSHKDYLVDSWKDWLNSYARLMDPQATAGLTEDQDNLGITDPNSAFYKMWYADYDHWYRYYNTVGRRFENYYYRDDLGLLRHDNPNLSEDKRISSSYTTVNSLAEYLLYRYRPGRNDMVRNSIFYINMIAYSQALDKVKVTGYYGGVARAFLVSYKPSGSIISIEEVPAEE